MRTRSWGGLVMVAVVAAALAGCGSKSGGANAAGQTISVSPSASASSPSPRATPAHRTGPVLTWTSYDGVTIGESMTAAAAHLGGRVAMNETFMVGAGPVPKPAGCGTTGHQIITGITPGVYIVSERGGPHAVVDLISFAPGVGVGPLGIRSGMTLAQARAVSGNPLTPTINATTGVPDYELPHGDLTFAFRAGPRVNYLTLVKTARLQQGGIFDGGAGC